jgi:hypothetical protein
MFYFTFLSILLIVFHVHSFAIGEDDGNFHVTVTYIYGHLPIWIITNCLSSCFVRFTTWSSHYLSYHLATPFIFYFLFFIFYFCLLSGVDTCPTVSFWMEKLMEVPITYFLKPQVPSVIQMKAHGAKNKVSKPQVPIRCLTYFFIIIIFGV